MNRLWDAWSRSQTQRATRSSFGDRALAKDAILIDVSEVKAHPNYLAIATPNGNVGKNFPNYDVAWVRLKENAPVGYKPIEILPLIEPLQNTGGRRRDQPRRLRQNSDRMHKVLGHAPQHQHVFPRIPE